MTHYICTGDCEGESGTAGVCKAEDCTKSGQPLVACDCEDGEHAEALSGAEAQQE
jgi:hypothetical protein